MDNSDIDLIRVNQYMIDHKKEFNKEMGKNIKEIRIRKNISTDEMAKKTLMSSSYIIQLENGVNGITLNKFIIICNSLGVSPNEVLENFLFLQNQNEDILYKDLQDGKNISKNILEFMKNKNSF